MPIDEDRFDQESERMARLLKRRFGWSGVPLEATVPCPLVVRLTDKGSGLAGDFDVSGPRARWLIAPSVHEAALQSAGWSPLDPDDLNSALGSSARGGQRRRP